MAPDGRIVITGMSHRMYVLDPAGGTFAIEPIPVPAANPRAVEIAADGTWWVLLGFPRKVARRAPDGTWTSWDIRMYPHGIGLARDGRVWFNGHFSKNPELLAVPDPTTGRVTRHEVLTPPQADGGSTIPYELRIGPDGAIWVSQLAGGRLVRFDLALRDVKFFGLPAPFAGPRRLDVDGAGREWVPEYTRNRLARVDPATERFAEWELPMPDALPYVVRLDEARGRLWIGTGAADAVLNGALHRLSAADPGGVGAARGCGPADGRALGGVRGVAVPGTGESRPHRALLQARRAVSPGAGCGSVAIPSRWLDGRAQHVWAEPLGATAIRFRYLDHGRRRLKLASSTP